MRCAICTKTDDGLGPEGKPFPASRLTVRRATEGDAARLHWLMCASTRAGWPGFYSGEQISAWCRLSTPDYHRGCILAREVLVAVVEGESVGFAQLHVEQRRIFSLYVAPGHVGHGIGSVLLRSLEHLALERDIAELGLSSSLCAAAFYERAGYRAGDRAELRLPGDLPLIVVPMHKRLEARRSR